MHIRLAAKATGLTAEAIRYFEREGLLEAPTRETNGYRSYSPAHIEQLHLIANCRALEMSHEEIRKIMTATRAKTGDCTLAGAVVREHLTHIESRIERLVALAARLKGLEARCDRGEPVAECDLIAELSRPIKARRMPLAGHLSAHAPP